ncbi:MAG: hypothetical protein P1V81_08765 [Planctomycetota bacterium]|nr:hypothetical protein [Planctomycetota bacterium]
MSSTPSIGLPQDYASDPIARRIAEVGAILLESLGAVLDGLPSAARGPQALATELGLDKVLCSRLLKAIRKNRDPLATVHHIPGPDPLLRFLRGAKKAGVEAGLVTAGIESVEAFRAFVRDEMGDRGNLETVVATWLPEARREFELRRKQSAFRAMSQLRGISTRVRMSSVFLAPSKTEGRLDLVWLMGYFGLRRLRPGARATFSTQRMLESVVGEASPRHPETLAGKAGVYPESYRLDEFCEAPAATVQATPHGEFIHYDLSGDLIGPGSEVDLILCEVNRAELPSSLPLGSRRKAHFSNEVATPTKLLVFDAFVHRDVYPGSEPELRLYDRIQGATADINDPSNEAYRLDMAESLTSLGSDPANFRSDAIGSYHEIVRSVFGRLGWDPAAFTGHRTRIEYPVLGTRVAMLFDPPQR